MQQGNTDSNKSIQTKQLARAVDLLFHKNI